MTWLKLIIKLVAIFWKIIIRNDSPLFNRYQISVTQANDQDKHYQKNILFHTEKFCYFIVKNTDKIESVYNCATLPTTNTLPTLS